jgi:hypothetical protein
VQVVKDPTVPTYLTGVMRIAAHGSHACVLVNNEVKCWGLNDKGQLGNGSNTGSPTPLWPFTWQ